MPDGLYGRRKGGSEFPVEISRSSIARESGALAIATFRDVSEQAGVEAQLEVVDLNDSSPTRCTGDRAPTRG